MSLNNQYRYLFLDFETTGLDVTTDYPIQIALIEVDHTFAVQKSYNSYITLPTNSDSLRTNISYITGIDEALLQSRWKTIETIQSEITDFFWDNVVLIGQNIAFDISFLNKFFPDCVFNFSIDTYKLWASSLLYLNSYSLEAFDKHLSSKSNYNKFKTNLLQKLSPKEKIDAHNALYDCIMWISLCNWRVEQLNTLTTKYPVLSLVVDKKNKDSFFQMIQEPEQVQITDLKLPTLTAPVKQVAKSSYTQATNREKIPQHSKFSTQWVQLQDIINELPKDAIIAVSHSSKIDIIKHACPNKQFDYLKEEQILDQENIKKWLHKSSFSDDEILFVLFYLSHHHQGYRILKPTLTTHHYILNYLHKKTIHTDSKHQILCSQGWLYYTLLESGRRDEYSSRPICLLDADWRHITYNNYAQKWINLDFSFSQWEKILYALDQEDNKEQVEAFKNLLNLRELFVGYFGIASEHELWSSTKRDFDYLPHHQHYKKSLELLKSLMKDRNQYSIHYTLHIEINQLLERLQSLLQNPLVIYRHSSTANESSYSISPSVKYIDFSEYLKLFGNQKLFFFSASRAEYKPRLTKTTTWKKEPTILQISENEQILEKISSLSGNTFIISHSAYKSKKLFHELTTSNFEKTHTLLWEYLTGWIGKNISLTQENNTIILWWYHLLLALRANQKPIQNIIIFALPASLGKFIEEDILQYATTNEKS